MSVSRSASLLARESAAAFDFDVVTDAPVLKSRKPDPSPAPAQPGAQRDRPETAKS